MSTLLWAVAGNDTRRDSQAEYRGCLDIVPFEAWHFTRFQLRSEQEIVAVDMTPAYCQSLAAAGEAFSAWVGPDLIAAAGVIHFWPGRAQVWAMMSWRLPQYGGLIHRHVKRYIQQHPVARLECVIDPRFPKSEEWAKRLGFKYESTMRAYGLHGQDMDMYVKHG